VKETGIVGSLRWWYETLVRAYGGRACDPTNSSCDQKDHCDACELFGCTGWSRKFRIEVHSKLKPIQRLSMTRKKRRIGGQLRFLSRYVSGLCGELDIKIIPIRALQDKERRNLYKTLQLVHEYAALGAKTSQGNGVVSIEKLNGFEPVPATNNALKNGSNTINLPVLSDFFFSRVQLRFKNTVRDIINKQLFWGMERDTNIWTDLWIKHGFLPIAFHARDAIRTIIQNRERRHEVFGERGKGSKVFVSHGYRINDLTVEARMFGYSLEKHEIDALRQAFTMNLPNYVSRIPERPLEVHIQETEFKTGRQLL
jgi:CRISPR type III-B/RAMP module RAMP protein Cmr1